MTPVVRSPLLASLGIAHGFSTRQGGVSEGRYASLNLSPKWGDDPARVAENRRRFAEAGPFALERLATARQVHGAAVLSVDGPLGAGEAPLPEADGLASSTPTVAVAVVTADCVPILLSDGQGRVAAVHAGWRGTVAEIARRGIEALLGLGAERSTLVAAMGPHICPDCFEVGEEVAAQFEGLGAVVRRAEWPRPHVDLYAANRALLLAAGVRADAIDERPACTHHEPERFFSFRRDGGQIGQQLSFIVAGR